LLIKKVQGQTSNADALVRKAKDIIDAPKALSMYGLDKPKLEVVLRQGTTELTRVAFGGDSKMPEGIY
jgi:hypothetical protein